MSKNPKRQSIDRQTMRLLWQTAKQNKKLLWAALLYPLGGVLINAVVPYFIGRIIAGAVSHNNASGYLLPLLGSILLGIVANRIGFVAFLRHQASTMAILEEKAFNALLRRSVGFHANNVGGRLVSDVIDFPESYNKLSSAFFATILPFVLVLLTGTTIVAIQSPILGIVVAIMAVFAIGSGIWDSRSRGAIRVARLKVRKAVTSHLADTVVNIQTVKTFARENDEINNHGTLGARLLELRRRDWSTAARQGNNRIMTLLAMQVVFVLVAVKTTQDNPSLLAASVFGFAFITTISNRLFETTTVMRTIDDSLLQASPMTEILMQEPEIKDTTLAPKLNYHSGQIDLQDLWFRYADARKNDNIFSKLNLNIKPGERIGLVGPSGGGKSTLTRLLLRFDDIQGGSINIDGQDISKVTQDSLRQTISYVPQEPLLFHRTISENIAYGRPKATLKEIKDAARMANAHDFIRALPDGYNTTVGERGVKLSGGQRQRVAIARAMLKNAPILVLDEATSALDSESERLVQDALWKLIDDKTAIVVAHRLSTIQRMNRIIVLDGGQIVEQGSHKDLLKANGLYAKLWSHQSGGFIEE